MAELACGHGQHARHDPPFTERSWVQSPEGRAAQLGTDRDCLRCDRRELPDGYAPHQRTPDFSETTIPEALLSEHSTKRGVWALIHVARGQLEYITEAPFHSREVLGPSLRGVVLPEVEHRVAPLGEVEFFVEFWRAAREGSKP